ncbi:alpha/beta hydrolase-fold protein [Butyrivibrio sp. DSM 10294]|uniref:carboxylesterase family protein n=1 Tax=Butyrivibrio sp. DSM 10294 TaxID=2972457 RepID=UPI00234F3902|nr:alpha/beta hydrolase-fold protein [Butyrivibrio sp. DSM 10294]MDC7292511.1 alpha/beta hydrolase-fold protein [Butyrivibrio sp. DSM 10294]
MFKRLVTILTTCAITVSAVACGSQAQQADSTQTVSSESNQETSDSSEEVKEEASDSAPETETTTDTGSTLELGLVSNTLAEDEEGLVETYTDLFDQLTYTDEETGLSITYNLYLPEGYDENAEYPMVVFIGDSTTAGTDAEYSLTQGLGGLVWATSEWQSVYPTIVAVPTYPETILDDHDGYSTTEYVELTKRFIDHMSDEYAVDTDRIYGTGQSMGCMTTLILASEYPDLYAACMFVDGQWDTELLSNLEGQTFVYFAAEDDTSAWTGAQDLMARYDADGATYTYAQWNGTWSADELSAAASELFSGEATGAYFISWKTGTIDAGTGNSPMGGGDGSFGERGNGGQMSSSEEGGLSNPEAATDASSDVSEDKPAMEMTGEKPQGMMGGNGGGAGGGATYHMASFDYAYNCIAVMEWLFQQ